MRASIETGAGVARRAALAAAALALVACSSVTDTLLESEDPDLIGPGNVNSVEGAIALYNGALSRFRATTGGDESTWLFGGLLVDEWSTSSTFVQNDETDLRKIQENNGSITGMFRRLGRVRTGTIQAIATLREFRPNPPSAIAEMYFARGFAEMQLAQDFCNGIPLSDAAGEEVNLGTPMTVEQVFQAAVASYDSALALATGTDAFSVSINRAARIGKARALLGLNQIAAAGALVPASAVPTSYTYDHTFAVTSGDNTVWGQGSSARRYTVGDSLEGNARNLLVRNVIPFFSARDPRLPVAYTLSTNGRDTVKSQDGFTFSRTTTLYGRTTPIAVVNGLDARLIEAEAALKAGNAALMLQILNALRAAPPKLGEVQPAVMPALTDPGTEVRRVDLLFREKAFWTFSRGQRLGDLRRLIRQYGRTAETTFPVGQHYRGGDFGTDLNLSVVTDERNNPSFNGCLDRKA